MKKISGFALALSLLSACSHISGPSPVRKAEPILQRGWYYLERDKELLSLEAGVDPVSFSAPILAGEKLVFGSDRFGIIALQRKTGRLLWRRNLDGGVMSAPLVDSSKVFVGTESGSVYALDLNGGAERWRATISGPAQGSFLLAFQRLYVSSADEALHCFDPSTGKLLWSYRRPGISGTTIRGGGNPAVIAGRIWIGFADGTLVSLNPESGGVESEKQFRDGLKFTDIDARIVGWREGLLVSTYDGHLRYLRKDGSTVWDFPQGGARAPVVGEGEVIYFPSSNGAVYALSGNTGKEIWNFPLRRGVPSSVALLTLNQKKVLVVTGSEDKVYVLDAINGQMLAQSSLGRGSGSYASIAADSEAGTFYVLSHFSRVHEFRLRL